VNIVKCKKKGIAFQIDSEPAILHCIVVNVYQGGTTFTGAGRELSEVMLSLDQYHTIILMPYHQSPGSSLLDQGK
jgi:hypothetical protein